MSCCTEIITKVDDLSTSIGDLNNENIAERLIALQQSSDVLNTNMQLALGLLGTIQAGLTSAGIGSYQLRDSIEGNPTSYAGYEEYDPDAPGFFSENWQILKSVLNNGVLTTTYAFSGNNPGIDYATAWSDPTQIAFI
jgi:hypothetical protein